MVLTAEMKLPGIATLSFEIDPVEEVGDKPVETGRARLVLTARFRPLGLFGIAYWYGVLPLHEWVFRGMLNGILGRAERRGASGKLRT